MTTPFSCTAFLLKNAKLASKSKMICTDWFGKKYISICSNVNRSAATMSASIVIPVASNIAITMLMPIKTKNPKATTQFKRLTARTIFDSLGTTPSLLQASFDQTLINSTYWWCFVNNCSRRFLVKLTMKLRLWILARWGPKISPARKRWDK